MSSGIQVVVSAADGAPFEPARRSRAPCPCQPQPCVDCRLLPVDSQQTEATEMTQETQQQEEEQESRPPWEHAACARCRSPVLGWRREGAAPPTCLRPCCLAAYAGRTIAYGPDGRPRRLQPLGGRRYACPFCRLVLEDPLYPSVEVFEHWELS